MFRYCMALENEPKHSYVGPAVTEIICFLSRTVEFEISFSKSSSAQAGGVLWTKSLSQVSVATDFRQHTLPDCSAYCIIHTRQE